MFSAQNTALFVALYSASKWVFSSFYVVASTFTLHRQTQKKHTLFLGLDGELAQRVDGALALLLQRDAGGVARRQRLADGAGLLRPQVQRLELLSAVELAQVLLRLLVNHDVHAGDGLAHNAAAGRTGNETGRR